MEQIETQGIQQVEAAQEDYLSNVKVQGDILKESIKSGEELALAALAAEICVMNVCKTNNEDQHKYFGRSQYPKFVK